MRRLAIKSSTSASVLLAIICAGSSASFAEEVRWTDNLTLSGTLETEWAGTTDDSSSQKFETILQPELNASLTDHSSLTGVFRIRGDAKDKLEQGNLAQGNYDQY